MPHEEKMAISYLYTWYCCLRKIACAYDVIPYSICLLEETETRYLPLRVCDIIKI